VFSTPLYFSRLTGTFIEPSNSECRAEDEHDSTSVSDSLLPPSDTADEQRERMMLWATMERLPVFLRH